MAAIKSGLIPKTDYGYDEEVFLKFWDLYEQILEKRNHSVQMLQKKNNKRRNRRKYFPFAVVLLLEFVVLALFFYFF